MIYLDTSVLVSMHIRDANTPAALILVRGTDEALLMSSLAEFETVNAFSLRVFRNEMQPINRDHAVRDLGDDVQYGVLTLLPLPDSAFARAKVLAQTLTSTIGVRALDLLHVAAAIELGASSLFTFDLKQHRTAQAAGLKVNHLP
jgi:predicted nucleic acid-binding protein